MANIVLTNKCNLNCSYCFAKEVTNENAEYFSMENFIKAINFIKTDKNERIGIVGGEPTIHPLFGNFMEIIAKDNEIQNCIIFTNGINLDKYIDILTNPKFKILVNCNSPDVIGDSYNKLEKNLELLNQKQNFALGINLYKTDFNYSYIFNLLKKFKKHSLRFSISVTNKEKQNCKNILKYLEKFTQILCSFYNDCIKNEIIPYSDCSGIPQCILDVNLKEIQLKIYTLGQKYNINADIFKQTCNPQTDILPDLTAVRSICFPYFKKIPINNYNSISHLKNYLYNDVDKYLHLCFASNKCKECNYRINGVCNLCPGFMLNQFKELKNNIISKDYDKENKKTLLECLKIRRHRY